MEAEKLKGVRPRIEEVRAAGGGRAGGAGVGRGKGTGWGGGVGWRGNWNV